MPTYREFLQQTKSEIDEVDASAAQELLSENSVAVVDVRERDEWDEGHLPQAVHGLWCAQANLIEPVRQAADAGAIYNSAGSVDDGPHAHGLAAR